MSISVLGAIGKVWLIFVVVYDLPCKGKHGRGWSGTRKAFHDRAQVGRQAKGSCKDMGKVGYGSHDRSNSCSCPEL
ncbi:hypothetical protein [Pontibacter brevis]